MLFSEAAIFQVATHLFIFETSKCVEIQISAFGFSKERKILLCEVVQDKENSLLCYALIVESHFSNVLSY